jgi:hypothetical protein
MFINKHILGKKNELTRLAQSAIGIYKIVGGFLISCFMNQTTRLTPKIAPITIPKISNSIYFPPKDSINPMTNFQIIVTPIPIPTIRANNVRIKVNTNNVSKIKIQIS